MKKKNLKQNVIYQTFYQVLMVISPLITSPYISRVLGATNIGIYNYCYSIAYYFGIFALLGIANYGNRSIARVAKDDKVKRSKVFWEIATMQLITSTIVIISYVTYIQLFVHEYTVYYFIELLYVLSVALDISWFFFGIEEFKTTTIRSSIIKILTIILIVTTVRSKDNLDIYTIIMAGGSLLSSFLLWPLLRNRIVIVKIRLSNIKKHVLPNIVLFIPVISLALFHYMDKVMLGSFSTMEELGYYSNADKVVNIPLGIIGGLGTVMMPRISSLATSFDWKSINKLINISILYSMWAGSAMCFGIIGIVRDFVPFFFGPGYDKCADILILFAPAVLIKAWSNIFRMQYLIPLGMDKQFNISVIAAAAINIIFNRIFMPSLGSVGAVIGTIIAETVVAVLYTIFSRKNINIKKSCLSSIVFFIIGIIMLIYIRFIGWLIPDCNIIVRLFIEIINGALIYIVISYVYLHKVYGIGVNSLLK